MPRWLKHRTETETYIWRVRYVAYLKRIRRVATARMHETILERVFDRMKDKTRFIDISTFDILDYRELRRKDGVKEGFIDKETVVLSYLFDFYINLAKQPMHNPAKLSKMRPYIGYGPRSKYRIRLDHANKMLETAKADPQEYIFASLLLEHGLSGVESWNVKKSDLQNGVLMAGIAVKRPIPASTGLVQAFEAAGEGCVLSGYCKNAYGLADRWRALCWKAEVPVVRMDAGRRMLAARMRMDGATWEQVGAHFGLVGKGLKSFKRNSSET